MKVLHVYNRHRGRGGSDNAWDATIRGSTGRGVDVAVFEKDSRDIGPGLGGKFSAFVNGIYSRGSVREFDRALRETRPDVVHAHELFPLISHWVLPRCRAAGIPVVFTCYDFRLTCPNATHHDGREVCHACTGGREYMAVLKDCRSSLAESIAYAARSAVSRRFRLVASSVTRYVVLSGFSMRWLVETLGIPGGRVSVNHCAIDIPEAPVDPCDGGYAAFAGRPAREKGIDVLIGAAARTGIPVKLAVPASTPMREAPPGGVEVIHTSTREELAAFYRGARMLVVPSTWYETFGIVAAEAMSHGVPVVASRIGALQDTVEDGVSGLLFNCGDAADLAEKMESVWKDDALCRRLGKAARERAVREFSGDAHHARLMEIYGRAIEDASSPLLS